MIDELSPWERVILSRHYARIADLEYNLLLAPPAFIADIKAALTAERNKLADNRRDILERHALIEGPNVPKATIDHP